MNQLTPQAVVTLFATVVTLVSVGSIYRLIGRVEASTSVLMDRVKKHSGAISEHTARLVRLEALPDKIDKLLTEIARLRKSMEP